jgi:hypothetical protein
MATPLPYGVIALSTIRYEKLMVVTREPDSKIDAFYSPTATISVQPLKAGMPRTTETSSSRATPNMRL